MKKTWVVIVVLLISAFVLVDHAAAETKKGDTEISGQLYFFIPSDGDEVINLFGSIGFFLTDRIELNLVSFISMTGDMTVGSVGPGVDYYFTPKTDTMYYIGGSFQLNMTDIDSGGTASETDDSFDIHVGLQHFITERTTLKCTLGHNDGLNGQYLVIGLAYFF